MPGEIPLGATGGRARWGWWRRAFGGFKRVEEVSVFYTDYGFMRFLLVPKGF